MGRRSDHKREDLRALALAAARRIMAAEGLRGLTARRLAQEIGYSSCPPICEMGVGTGLRTRPKRTAGGCMACDPSDGVFLKLAGLVSLFVRNAA